VSDSSSDSGSRLDVSDSSSDSGSRVDVSDSSSDSGSRLDVSDSTPITDGDLALPPDEPRIGEAEAKPREELPMTAPQAAQAAGVAPGEPASPPGGGIEVEDDGMPATDVMREAMKAVMDPELGYNVVDLGLLYDIEKEGDGHVQITMTLTTMGCPLTELIHQQVSVVLGSLPGVKGVDVEFTFSPPWSPEMMSDDVRDELRAMGMNV
jgi:metal-sulfur cluster biosynthetic enzyme